MRAWLKAADTLDTMLPSVRQFALGFRHVPSVYAGAVVAPLILGGVRRLPPKHVAILISAVFSACGIVTLVQV